MARLIRVGVVGLGQWGQHHVRVVGGPAGPVVGVAGMKGGGVQPADDVDDEPGEVALLQPVGHADGQQQDLVPLRSHVVKRHPLPLPDTSHRNPSIILGSCPDEVDFPWERGWRMAR